MEEWISAETERKECDFRCDVHWKPNLFNGRPGVPLNEYPAGV